MKSKKKISLLVSAAILSTSYGFVPAHAETDNSPLYHYNFEEESLSDIDAVFEGGASLVYDEDLLSRVLYLDGTTGTYMQLDAPTDDAGSVLESYTLSFDVKNNTSGNYFNFYIGDGSSANPGVNYLAVKISNNIFVSARDSATEKKAVLAADDLQGTWNHLDISVDNGDVSVYLNKELIGTMSGYAMNEINASVIRFGFSAWRGDNASNAYYDNIKTYGRVLTADEINTVNDGDKNPFVYLDFPYAKEDYKIAGNITLPEEIDGYPDVTVNWTSSNEEVINTEAVEFSSEEIEEYGENYSVIPAGIVTRQAEDTAVTLTAAIEYNEQQYTRDFNVVVKAKPEKNYKEMDEDGDFTGYLYASFIEPKSTKEYQQTYFALSDDGMNWKNLNNNRAVLTSSMGTGGLRDHYIVRAPEGDRFYLLATDLDSTSGNWISFAENGSKSIMIWESDDLVNWSEQRMVRIADDNTGCAWAPETIYDEITGEYIVYWSGHDINPESANYGKKVVYCSRTRDFYSFSPQQQFVYPTETDGTESGTSTSFIDTTMIQGSDGNFYRVTKYEDVSPTQVFMDVAKYPMGEFKRVKTNLSEETFLGTEGPGWFKLNKDDAEATGNKFCMMIDGYNGPNVGVGFFPTVVEDLNNTEEINFTRVTENFKMRSYAKHGGIIPVTQEEYDRLNEVYESAETQYTEERQEPVSSYDFEQEELTDISATFTSGASLVDDAETESRVLYLDGTAGSYMELEVPKDEDGNPLEHYTVSFDIKNNTTGNYFNFYVGDGSVNNFGVNYLGVKVGNTILVSSKDTSAERNTTISVSDVQGEWKHFDIVVSSGIVQVYVDKALKGTLEGYLMSEINPSVIRFGFSAWRGDGASNAYYDNIEVYDCALAENVIAMVDGREDLDTNKLLFGMNFNNQDMSTFAGEATANGTITFEESNDGSYAAVLDGTSGFISATAADGAPLLKGKDKIVVSLYAKLERNSTTGWYFYTAPNANAQNGGRRNYIGILDNYTNIIAERFLNNRTIPVVSAASSVGNWQNIVLVIDETATDMYIDGKYIGTSEYNYSLSDILGESDSQVVYFGKANWGNGEYAKGLIDDIAIYDFAPRIELGNLYNVQEDINLPTATAEEDGYTLSWTSSNEDIISSTGKLNRPATGKEEITLTATITFGSQVLKRTFTAVVKGTEYYDFQLNVSSDKGVKIQPNMYGLFFEDINYAGDGGLYAEMIENRSFEQITSNGTGGTDNTYKNPGYAWSAVSGEMTYKTDAPLNENNPTYLEFTGTSFKNQAYQGMYIEKDKKYKVSFFAKSDSFAGDISVSISKDGTTALSGVVASDVTNEWKKYEVELTATNTVRYGDFVITLPETATVDFDMISVMPSDAVNGVLRRDLVEKLKELNPGFLRFPGGCIIEGYDIENRYQWKNSVGPVEERVHNWNRWATDSGFVNYNQTLGLGFFEYFELCEYLECDPLPVLNVGMACEYQSKETIPMYEEDGVTYTEEFYQYIQDALDLIEFANGDSSTTWGKVRVDMGHEEPFNMTMLGIGNEQWYIEGNQWYERYEAFEKEIHKVYPDMKLISTSGPSAGGALFDNAWSWLRENQAENDNFTYAVDEHYYMNPAWFLENDTRYDNYDRGTKVFAGEYAAHTRLTGDQTRKNNLESALAEAAFMTGFERNADVVYMASYAPLFARLGYTQWAPDMIWFDDVTSYNTPTYYVQSMYANNNGSYTLANEVTSNEEKIYETVSYDQKTGDVIVKIANPYSYEQRAKFVLDSSLDLTGTADVISLSGSEPAAVNSISDPDNISPVESTISVSNNMDYYIPAYTFVVIRMHTNRSELTFTKCEIEDGVLNYAVTSDIDVSAHDLYLAVYDEEGKLVKVSKNTVSDSLTADSDTSYTVKAMLWEKDTMKPVMEAVQTVVNSQYKLMSYTTDGSEYYAQWSSENPALIGNSLHLAVSDDNGDSFEPLNSNIGVLYAEADYESNPVNGVGKLLKAPYIFRTKDGGWGVISARGDEAKETDNTDGSVMVYFSEDLASYEFKGYLELDETAIVNPVCEYKDGAYTISWNDANGTRKNAKTTDFTSITDVKESDEVYVRPSAGIANAEATAVVDITKTEYENLCNALNAPENTGIVPIDDITVNSGEEISLPERVTATYSDDSVQDYNVEWEETDFSSPGEYVVNGKVITKDYATDLIPNRADPCMVKTEDGKYYFVATRDSGGQTVINIREGDTIDEIATAEDNEILSTTGDLIWAPEIHVVDGTLMIFFARGNGWKNVQSHVMCLEGSNPLSASDWSTPERITLPNGEYLIGNGVGITLDMTCFNYNGKYYLAWAQRTVADATYGIGSSDIYIAEYNPSENVARVTTDPVIITKPYFGWERTKTCVDEGPFTIQNDGRLFMTVATNGTDYSYGIKLLSLSENGDPMNPDDWTAKGYPLLATAMNNVEPGPGHSSFTVDENGDPVLVYHWGRTGSGRTTTVKKVHFNTKGEPVLNIMRGNQVLDEYKDVTVKVIVK